MLDGGLSNNIPKLDRDTITVSPLAGEHSIAPRDDVGHTMPITLMNMSMEVSFENLERFKHAFYPPHYETLIEYCWQGYDNALNFLMDNSECCIFF